MLRFWEDGAPMSETETTANRPSGIAPEIVRVAVGRVCGSQVFRPADRQQALLRFLVEEDLSGRAMQGSKDAVIATFYADRDPDEAETKLVWAFSRLAEKLDEYYQAEGADDPMRFLVDMRRFGLQFQMREADPPRAVTAASSVAMIRLLAPLVALIVALIIGITLVLLPPDTAQDPTARAGGEEAAKEVQALIDDYAHLTIVEHELEARNHLFPFLEIEAQKRAVASANVVILRDPDFGRGYATAGYGLATMALMTAGGAVSRRHLEEARLMRDRALALSPEDAWVLSAAALTFYAEREYEQAISYSEKAYAAGADDPYVASAYSVLALVTARYEESLDASKDRGPTDFPKIGYGLERVHAFASFHLGDHDTTIQKLERLEREGYPHNVTTAMYLAAAHQVTGNHAQANEMVQRIKTDWPTFRPERIPTLFFREPAEADFLLQNLAAAGWSFID